MSFWLLGATAITVGVALGATIALVVAQRAARVRPAIQSLLAPQRPPLVLLCAAIAFRVNGDDAPFDGWGRDTMVVLTDITMVLLSTWLALRALTVLEASMTGHFDVATADNRRARARRTQVDVLRRVASVVVISIALIAVLRSFEWGQNIGTSLLAASGVIGIVIGVTGRSTIGNMIAGVQIAISEPIRLDDVVVVEEEWGIVEEITLLYVVVRLWDERRLVVPTSYFVESTFQNWTRQRSEIMGTVELWVDYSTDVSALRAEFLAAGESWPEWDGRLAELQVTNASPHALLVRALVSARHASALWNLRCSVQKHLASWLASQPRSAVPMLWVTASGGPA